MATGGDQDGGKDQVPRNMNSLLQSFIELSKDQDQPASLAPMTDEVGCGMLFVFLNPFSPMM